nr:probable E3 ubiquitin-protein ligase HERC4 [Lytechinus pictus]
MSVFSWGCAQDRQLGIPGVGDDVTSITSPKEVSLAGNQVLEISCGLRHTCVLLQDGTVMTCGANDRGQLGQERSGSELAQVPATDTLVVTQISCGNDHTLAVTDRGQVLGWGRDDRGQCGMSSGGREDKRKPRLLKSLSSCQVAQVACGSLHSMALTRDGRIYAWGDNSFGQLGIGVPGRTLYRDHPQLLSSLPGVPIRRLACGGWHSFALSISGAVFGWGKNNCGQLGLGTTEDRVHPTLLKNLKTQRVKYIACGQNYTAMLTASGGLFLFGQGSDGQLGHGSHSDEINPRKVLDFLGSEITQVACGRKHTLVLEGRTGRFYSFGQGSKGQLGLDNDSSMSCATLVPCPWKAKNSTAGYSNGEETRSIVGSIFAGGDHSFCTILRGDDCDHPLDFREALSNVEPVVLTKDLLQEVSDYAPSSPSKAIQTLEMVLSSPPCLNASFLVGNDDHFYRDQFNDKHGIDLDAARSAFECLSGKMDIIKMISGIINSHLIPTLQKHPLVYPVSESLRLYLLIMECPALSHPSQQWCRQTILQMGKALLNLSADAEETIDRWWSSMLPRHLNRILTIHKDCVLSILESPSVSTTGDIQTQWTSMRVLEKLHKINTRSGEILPYYKFHIPNIGKYINMQDDFLQFFKSTVLHSMGCEAKTFCDYPFVFDADMKSSLLHLDALLQMQFAMEEVQRANFANVFFNMDPVNPCLVLCVMRENLVSSAIDQLGHLDQHNLKKPLKVIFVGEEAIDAGGVQKEFFMLIMREILDPKYGMFRYFEDSGKIWFNSKSFEDIKMFRLVGLICGLAIYNNMIISLPFPLALYKKLLDRETTLDDFKQLEPQVAQNLQSVLDYDDPESFSETFPLFFQINEDNFGEVETSDLVPNGSEKELTFKNRNDYVMAYVNYCLNSSVREQFEAFSSGFLEVCGGHVLRFFHPQELMAMVIGNEEFNWDELEETVQYKGEYSAGHPTIKFFWQVFREMAVDDKRKFLVFLTGSNHVPIQGWKSLQVIIQPVKGGEDFFPVAHTCFNLLDLPIYTSKEVLREKLLTAIEHTEGFTLA